MTPSGSDFGLVRRKKALFLVATGGELECLIDDVPPLELSSCDFRHGAL